MNAILLITASGPLLVLSSHDSPLSEVFLSKLHAKGIEKFIAHELSLEAIKPLYGAHFSKVTQDLHETDDLRVLDYNGHRIFQLLRLDQLGEAIIYEPGG